MPEKWQQEEMFKIWMYSEQLIQDIKVSKLLNTLHPSLSWILRTQCAQDYLVNNTCNPYYFMHHKEVTRKLHHNEFCNLYSSPHAITISKPSKK